MDPIILLAIGMIVVLGSILLFRMHALLALFMGALCVGLLTTAENLNLYIESLPTATAKDQSVLANAKLLPGQSVGTRIANGFGATCAGVGLLIALASIIGKMLLDSGGADRIVRSMLRWFGEKRASLAFLGSGFVLGIPVFVDTVFYLLLPLAKAMATRHERKYLLYILCIVAGASMTHSLVPPTPGPLLVAGMLNVNIGTMILAGLVVGAFTSSSGYLYALWANRRWPLPLRETADISLAELKTLAEKDERDLPPFWLAVLPILLPIVLISGRTIIGQLAKNPDFNIAPDGFLMAFFTQFGDSNVALGIAAAVAIFMLVRQKSVDKKQLAKSIESALLSAGSIILITAMGGAFGTTLKETGIGPRIVELTGQSTHWILPLAFFVTTIIRTAQGSATVAMITAAGILTGFADPAILGCNPVWLALAIGCGSKPYPWMNDSGFWLIGRMSGMNEVETLRSSSATISVMGVVGLPVIMIGAKLFPMMPQAAQIVP